MDKPRQGFAGLWNISFGFFGIQIGFALQNANMSRIFQSLGEDIEKLPGLWVAAPLTGLLVQPVIGHMSDRTWLGRLGRRRPYFLAGAILAAIALFDSLAPEAQMAFLEGTLDELPNFSNSLNAMLTDWAEGDAERLQELIRESDPAMAEALLARRNTSWAQWIKNRMEQPGTVFMAVGAGHLAGKGSVQSELRKHGLKARRDDNEPYDTIEMAGKNWNFDGDWKKAKLSEDEYMKGFTQAEQEYVKMLEALLSELKKTS